MLRLQILCHLAADEVMWDDVCKKKRSPAGIGEVADTGHHQQHTSNNSVAMRIPGGHPICLHYSNAPVSKLIKQVNNRMVNGIRVYR